MNSQKIPVSRSRRRPSAVRNGEEPFARRSDLARLRVAAVEQGDLRQTLESDQQDAPRADDRPDLFTEGALGKAFDIDLPAGDSS